MKKFGKKILSAVLCVALTVSLAGCGGKGDGAADSNAKEFVYVPEYITLNGEGENSHFNNLKVNGNNLYYTEYVYDEVAMTSTESICCYSLEDGTVTKRPMPAMENGGIDNYNVDANGNLYTVVSDYSSDKMDESGFPIPNVSINKYDAQGAELFCKDITDTVVNAGEYVYIRDIVLDSLGNIYVCLEPGVVVLNPEGDELFYAEVSGGWINSIGVGKDGKVYVSYYDSTSSNGGYVLADIDLTAKKIGSVYKNVPSMGSTLAAGAQKDFLGQDSTNVYEYDLATQSYEVLLNWLDCDINGSYVENVAATEDGNLLAVVRDWDTNVTEIVKLKKTAASEVVQKEEIVIGVMYQSQDLQAAAVNFNKSNDAYHVTIKEYIDSNNWTETSYSDGMMKLNNDITSGSNCPDILELSALNGQQLVAKGVLEDLTPYLEQSSVFHKEDFLDGLLDGFTYEGKLITIPASFDLMTVVGKTSLLGEEMGWSMEEMISFAKEHPDAQLLDAATQSLMLQYCMMFNQDAFINWSEGQCNFDSEEFKQMLEFVAMFPEEIDWNNYEGGAKIEERQADKILLDAVGIYDFQEVQVYPEMYGEDVTFIGYPTTDGSVGCMMSAGTQFAITTKSENKDGAWAFMESYLVGTKDSMFSWGFPSLKEDFEAKIAEITKVEYMLDENGEQILDENGEPIVIGGSSSIGWEDWEYTYHTPTEEEIALVRELISVAKPTSSNMGDDEILNIIIEESEGYLKGQKSLDEVVDIIQSRAQIYISENS